MVQQVRRTIYYDDDGFDNVKTAGVALDYWVNEQFSVSASYETDIDSDVDSDVASLTAARRRAAG